MFVIELLFFSWPFLFENGPDFENMSTAGMALMIYIFLAPLINSINNLILIKTCKTYLAVKTSLKIFFWILTVLCIGVIVLFGFGLLQLLHDLINDPFTKSISAGNTAFWIFVVLGVAFFLNLINIVISQIIFISKIRRNKRYQEDMINEIGT